MVSFAEKYPELVTDWSDLNGALQPNQVSYGSNKKVWWQGKCGHNWYGSVKNHGRGHGCPYCSGNKVMPGFNDLASQYPELVKEWSPWNRQLKPYQISPKSNKKVWWDCRKCNHSWQARIADRTDGHGCPSCAGEVIEPGFNDLATICPELAVEWSDKNAPLKIEEVFPGSEQRIWWKCSMCGYEWRVSLRRRVGGNGHCPACQARKRKQKALGRRLDREFEVVRIPETIIYYLRKAGVDVVRDDEAEIGINLPIFLPDLRVAISIEENRKIDSNRYMEEIIKENLCKKVGIRLIRIQRNTPITYPNSICIHTGVYWVSMDEALAAMFDIIGLDIQVDTKHDRGAILDEYIRFH